MIQKIDLAEKFCQFSDHWHPRIVAELNGQHVKVAKLLGEFDWHTHANEDELFLVIRGELQIQIRDDSGEQLIELSSGQMCVVPRGTMHKPVAREECEVVLFEPTNTLNTGDAVTDRTRNRLERI